MQAGYAKNKAPDGSGALLLSFIEFTIQAGSAIRVRSDVDDTEIIVANLGQVAKVVVAYAVQQRAVRSKKGLDSIEAGYSSAGYAVSTFMPVQVCLSRSQ